MTEYVIIKLGQYTPTNEERVGYDKKRYAYGWKEGMSTEDAWLSALGFWRADPTHIMHCYYGIVINSNKKIVAVGKIDGVYRSQDNSSRITLIGDVSNNQEHAEWVGKYIPSAKSRNPVTYMKNPSTFITNSPEM